MEKFSSFERVVGDIPETEKEQILQDKGERFDDQSFKDLEGKEREKTSEELQIIFLVDKAANEIRRRYDLKDFNIPPKNIHIIPEEAWPTGERSGAFYSSMLQAVAVREQPAKIVFMERVFHEMLHFKSYNALQITANESPRLDEYRCGLTVHARDVEKMYFANLNEAVTEEMTKEAVKKLFDNPLFVDEIKKTKEVMTRYPEAVVSGSSESLFDDDTYYAEIKSKKSWKEAVGRLFGEQEKSKKINVGNFTYRQERRILNVLIDKIFAKNPEKFQDREEVFEVFAKGMMTGSILPIGRLIDKSFGSGTLRRIGELDRDIQEQEKFVNSL